MRNHTPHIKREIFSLALKDLSGYPSLALFSLSANASSMMHTPDPLLFRALPAMGLILDFFATPSTLASVNAQDAARASSLHATLPRPLLRESIESFLELCRAHIRQGTVADASSLTLPALVSDLVRHVEAVSRPRLRPVLNATGVVIHTNLGRSVLAEEAAKAALQAALSYSNLELDLGTGKRGSRYSHVEKLLCRLTGAEAALVVNNNAAAVLLMLDTLCKGREVVVSRGELVEIGGSFRIPEVMEKSGCILKETGATNRTHVKDYAASINEHTAALLKVHASNFRIIGFVKSPDRKELAELAHTHDLPLLEDLGSGTLFDFAAAGFAHMGDEPTAARVLEQGVDLVSFSGDKVLGGPQAGILAGKAAYMERIKNNPLTRALRIDKMTLAALEATLRLYLDPALALQRIPTLRMLCLREEELRRRAQSLARMLKQRFKTKPPPSCAIEIFLRSGSSRSGGGAFPERELPTCLVCLRCASISPDALRKSLLKTSPPLIARVEEDALCLDPRTLMEKEFTLVARILEQALALLSNA